MRGNPTARFGFHARLGQNHNCKYVFQYYQTCALQDKCICAHCLEDFGIPSVLQENQAVQLLDRTREVGPLRIVIAEDYRPLAMTLAWTMEAHGHIAKYCLNGNEAIVLVESFKPHVVVLDINMPILDGLSACKRIRASKDSSGILVVAYSAWSNLGRRAEFAAAGFDAHFLKPLDFDKLHDFIRPWH